MKSLRRTTDEQWSL